MLIVLIQSNDLGKEKTILFWVKNQQALDETII